MDEDEVENADKDSALREHLNSKERRELEERYTPHFRFGKNPTAFYDIKVLSRNLMLILSSSYGDEIVNSLNEENADGRKICVDISIDKLNQTIKSKKETKWMGSAPKENYTFSNNNFVKEDFAYLRLIVSHFYSQIMGGPVTFRRN